MAWAPALTLTHNVLLMVSQLSMPCNHRSSRAQGIPFFGTLGSATSQETVTRKPGPNGAIATALVAGHAGLVRFSEVLPTPSLLRHRITLDSPDDDSDAGCSAPEDSGVGRVSSCCRESTCTSWRLSRLILGTFINLFRGPLLAGRMS